MPNNLIRGTKNYTDNMINKAPFVDIRTARILASEIDGYTIFLDGVTYYRIPTLESGLSVNDTVKVVVKNKNYNNMFIQGKLKLV